ncbi:hypothetical protein BDA99DRAFT_216301 [Phascolomyces articulosus]|uniref:Uncharacterized protein n=1 Tax=Phascolomyces articulosus TaxID=60185 RepID=A0AAD5JQI6_9FUNG|nr:hypothetical protein BDA99DRAFT_216301 [Phascolomyces articulosus]
MDAVDDMEKESHHSNSNNNNKIQFASSLGALNKSVTTKGPSALFEQTNTLRSLNVWCDNRVYVDQIMMNMLTCIGTCTPLQKLDISNVGFNNEQLTAFLRSMINSNVYTLRILTPHRHVVEKELKALASLPRVEVLHIFDYGKKLGEKFNKPRLFRLFQEYQMDRPFIVYVYGPLNINGWKEPSTSSTSVLSSVSNDEVKCLHKLYSIQESGINTSNSEDENDT